MPPQNTSRTHSSMKRTSAVYGSPVGSPVSASKRNRKSISASTCTGAMTDSTSSFAPSSSRRVTLTEDSFTTLDAVRWSSTSARLVVASGPPDAPRTTSRSASGEGLRTASPRLGALPAVSPNVSPPRFRMASPSKITESDPVESRFGAESGSPCQDAHGRRGTLVAEAIQLSLGDEENFEATARSSASESSESNVSCLLLPVQMPFVGNVPVPAVAKEAPPRVTSATSAESRAEGSDCTAAHLSRKSSWSDRASMTPLMNGSGHHPSGIGAPTAAAAAAGGVAGLAEQPWMRAYSSSGPLVQLLADVGATSQAPHETSAVAERAHRERASASNRSTYAGINGAASAGSSLGASGVSATPFSSNLSWAALRAPTAFSAAQHNGAVGGNSTASRQVHLSPLLGNSSRGGVANSHAGSFAGENTFSASYRGHPSQYQPTPPSLLPHHRSGDTVEGAAAPISARSVSAEVNELDALRLQVLRELRDCKEQIRRQQQELNTLSTIASSGRKPLRDTLNESAGGAGAMALSVSEKRNSQPSSRYSSPTRNVGTEVAASSAETIACASLLTGRASSMVSPAVCDATLSLAELDAFERRVVQLILNGESAFGVVPPAAATRFLPDEETDVGGARLSRSSAQLSPVSPRLSEARRSPSRDLSDVTELPVVLARGITDFSTLELLVSNPSLRPVALKPVRQRWAAFKKTFNVGEEYYAVKNALEWRQRQREGELLCATLSGGDGLGDCGGGGGSFAGSQGERTLSPSHTTLSSLNVQPPCRHSRTSTSPSLAGSVGSAGWRIPRHSQQTSLVTLTGLVRKLEGMKDKDVVALIMNPNASSVAPRVF